MMDNRHSCRRDPSQRNLGLTLALAIGLVAAACSSEEAPRVAAHVVVDDSGLQPVVSDLGYTVIVTRARAALRDLAFTVGGETHARGGWGRWLLGTAHAHPGHQAGGETTGELTGPFIADWSLDGTTLGMASLVAGAYRGANFTFRRAQARELPPGDRLAGHTFLLEGTASKDGRRVAFTALLDMDENTHLIGAPFDQAIAASPTPIVLGLRLLSADPTTPGQTVFNQVDFFALAGAADQVAITPGQPAHNLLFKALQVHDHYDIRPR